METVFKILLTLVLGLMVLAGTAGIVLGVIQGAWHGVLIGAVMLAIPYAWYREEHKDD